VASSIPFRFKAGGSGTSNMSAPGHHHRSTTKQSKKGFKSRHATKSSLKEQSKGMRRLPFPTCNF
jgi:pre-rRNA-processing protein TSR1